MERSEYLKNYRNQNKDKIKKYNEKYYDKKRKLKIINTDHTNDEKSNDEKSNDEINKIPNLNFGERMKLLREKKMDNFIKKMKENGIISDDSDDTEKSEEENNKNENSEDDKNEINFKKIPFDVDSKNDNILSVKDLLYEIHNLND